MMPCRTTTRAHNHTRYIQRERTRNHQARHRSKTRPAPGDDAWTTALNTPADPNAEPPPF